MHPLRPIADSTPLPEFKGRAVKLGIRHKLLKILVVQFVEQFLGILRVEPENLVGSGTSEGLTDLAPIGAVLHLNSHPTFRAKGCLADAARGIHTDINESAGDGHICPFGSSPFDDGRIPTFSFEKVSERLCRSLAKSAVREAEVTLSSP